MHEGGRTITDALPSDAGRETVRSWNTRRATSRRVRSAPAQLGRDRRQRPARNGQKKRPDHLVDASDGRSARGGGSVRGWSRGGAGPVVVVAARGGEQAEQV